MTVTSQHKDLPLGHGTSVRPSDLFPSVRSNRDIIIIITVYYAIKGNMNAYKQDNIKE